MHFSIDRKYFYDKLSIVSRAISVFSPLPALSGICIDLKDGSMILTGSDSNISIRTVIVPGELNNLDIEEEGSIIIDSKYLLEIVRKLDCKNIEIEVIDYSLVRISSDNGQFNLNGIRSNEYPDIDFTQPNHHFVLKATDLKSIVSQTAFACSDKDQRPVLTGVNFNSQGNMLYCSGTDSYRLANKVVNLEKSSEENFNIVIPSHNILEFTRILDDDEDGNVEMHISNNKVLFIYKNLKFQSRLINGTYPNTSNLMPKEDFLIVYTKLNDLYNVIDRASILTSDKDKNIVTLETNGNVLTLKSSSQEIGRVEEKMNITKNNEEEIRISFSAKYMMEALKSFSTETVEIHFVGEIKPILVKSSEDETLTQLVLPIRTY